MSEQDSGFTTEGFKDIPNTYFDLQRVHDIAMWSDDKIDSEFLRYNDFIKSDDCTPRAKAEAMRLQEYIMFEWQWRRGAFAHDLRFDEVCEGA